jgi:hypothetical protein
VTFEFVNSASKYGPSVHHHQQQQQQQQQNDIYAALLVNAASLNNTDLVNK